MQKSKKLKICHYYLLYTIDFNNISHHSNYVNNNIVDSDT